MVEHQLHAGRGQLLSREQRLILLAAAKGEENILANVRRKFLGTYMSRELLLIPIITENQYIP